MRIALVLVAGILAGCSGGASSIVSPTASADASVSATPSPSDLPAPVSISSTKVTDRSGDLEFTKSSDVGAISSNLKAQFSGVDLQKCWANTDLNTMDVQCTMGGDTTRFDPVDADQTYGWTLDYTGNSEPDLWVLAANDSNAFRIESTLLPSYSAFPGQTRVQFSQSGKAISVSIPMAPLGIDASHLNGDVPVTICAYAKLQAFSGASWVKGFDVLKGTVHCVEKHIPSISLNLDPAKSSGGSSGSGTGATPSPTQNEVSNWLPTPVPSIDPASVDPETYWQHLLAQRPCARTSSDGSCGYTSSYKGRNLFRVDNVVKAVVTGWCHSYECTAPIWTSWYRCATNDPDPGWEIMQGVEDAESGNAGWVGTEVPSDCVKVKSNSLVNLSGETYYRITKADVGSVLRVYATGQVYSSTLGTVVVQGGYLHVWSAASPKIVPN